LIGGHRCTDRQVDRKPDGWESGRQEDRSTGEQGQDSGGRAVTRSVAYGQVARKDTDRYTRQVDSYTSKDVDW
jgi:hypothetical protein